jgi:hypothetical protein
VTSRGRWLTAVKALSGPLRFGDQVETFEYGFEAFAGDPLREYLAGFARRRS